MTWIKFWAWFFRDKPLPEQPKWPFGNKVPTGPFIHSHDCPVPPARAALKAVEGK